MKIRIPFALVLSLSACEGQVALSASGSADGAGGDAGTGASASTVVGNGGATESGGGALCGGLKGLSCAADEWCDFPGDDCGGDDGTGVCRKRPESCSAPSDGVCACDGKSYPDACHAEQAGLDVRGKVACGGPAPFPCGPSLLCKTGEEFCDVEDGIVAAYTCLPLPASCLPPNAAVCGCMGTPPDCGACAGTTGQLNSYHGCG